MAAEKQFETKVKEFLKAQGCWYVKYFANRMTKSGIPDIMACVNGRFVAIEVKAENGRATQLQLWNRQQIRNANGISIVLYPEQFNEFKKLIVDLLENKEYKDICKDQRTFD